MRCKGFPQRLQLPKAGWRWMLFRTAFPRFGSGSSFLRHLLCQAPLGLRKHRPTGTDASAWERIGAKDQQGPN